MNFIKPHQRVTRVSMDFKDADGVPIPSVTKQSHKDECDVNVILRRYDRDGIITHVQRATGEYGDYTEVNEYQESMNMVIRAQAAFMELPSDIRKRFGNDPGNFFEFATNPKNADELVKLGLAKAPELVPEVIQKVIVVEPEKAE